MQHYNNIQLIETEQDLAIFCDKVKHAPFIALDTEFIRENTYYPKLCLLQACAGEHIACIDPIRIKDLTPLWQIMFDNNITKVFHAARQDLEIVYHLQKRLPETVFDTQIAAPLLGFAEQIGYGNLVKELLDIELAKAHTRTDWQRRPLSSAQLQYAADDVYHLHEIYKIIKQRLDVANRTAWLQDDFLQLSEPSLYDPDPNQAWIHIKDINKFSGKTLAIIQGLAAWREITAKNDDMPRNWLLRDEMIADIAKLCPDTTEQLQNLRNLPQKIVERYGKRIVEDVQKNASRKPEPLPEFKRITKLSAVQEAKLDILLALTTIIGSRVNINPAILAGKKSLKRIVLGEPPELVFSGWRKELLCENVRKLLEGTIRLVFKNEQLVIETVEQAS